MLPRAPLPLLTLLILPIAASLAAPQAADVHALVHVDARAAAPEALLALGLDVVRFDPETRSSELVAGTADLRELRRRGIPFDVRIEDMASWFERRAAAEPPPEGPPALGAWLSPPFGQGSMGGYYTFAEVVSVLDQMRAAHPTRISARTSIGQSLQGRHQWAVKISDRPDLEESEPEARFDSLHHAREPESMQATLWFMLFLLERHGSDPLATYLVNERELWFVPVVNPDGYVHNQTTNPNGGGMWRKNRRNNGDGTTGVDLNRNYPHEWGYDNLGSSPNGSSETYRGPAPASEPEVVNMVAFLSARDFATALSTHTYSNEWLHAWGYDVLVPAAIDHFDEISALATAENGYPAGPAATVHGKANGVTLDYDHGAHGTLSWTPEIGNSADNFWPAPSRIVPLAEDNLLGFQVTALAAGVLVRAAAIDLAEVGDGDGFHEAGETVELRATLRNSGLAATATSVVGTLSSASPWVAVTSAVYDFGSLASLAQADNDASPLALQVLPTAPPGARVDLELSMAFDGYATTATCRFIVGEAIEIVADDVELDHGWTAGLPGDTATTGQWVRVDPIGTTSGGQPANPADDDTPGVGALCWVTGNGGANASSNDVDGGFTTLISPALDLSALGPALVSYARWHADLSNVDDVFRISISDDDGATWSELEAVAGNANQWTRVAFEVGDHVAQTESVRLRFVAEDFSNNSIVEAAVDTLRVTIHDDVPRLLAYGAASLGGSVQLNVSGPPGASWFLFAVADGAPELPLTASAARRRWVPTPLPGGTIPAERVDRVAYAIPNDPAFSGTTLNLRAVVVHGGTARTTNVVSLTVP